MKKGLIGMKAVRSVSLTKWLVDWEDPKESPNDGPGLLLGHPTPVTTASTQTKRKTKTLGDVDKR